MVCLTITKSSCIQVRIEFATPFINNNSNAVWSSKTPVRNEQDSLNSPLLYGRYWLGGSILESNNETINQQQACAFNVRLCCGIGCINRERANPDQQFDRDQQRVLLHLLERFG